MAQYHRLINNLAVLTAGRDMAGVRVEHIITALGGHLTLCYKECSIINLFLSVGEGEKEV